MQNMNILTCSNVEKVFGRKVVVHDLSLTLMRGRFVGLLGPNGCGKTTTIKMINGLLQPTRGEILIDGEHPGTYTHSIISYLPDRPYLPEWMKVSNLFDFFNDFYADFDRTKATEMLRSLNISSEEKLKNLSKGTKEKVQLILTMSRKVQLYLLDEPIGGVDPAARDYILSTILNNYSEDATVLLSTHLIADIERVLDDVIFMRDGGVVMHATVDEIREQHGKSVDELFREVFAC